MRYSYNFCKTFDSTSSGNLFNNKTYSLCLKTSEALTSRRGRTARGEFAGSADPPAPAVDRRGSAFADAAPPGGPAKRSKECTAVEIVTDY